MTNEEPTF